MNELLPCPFCGSKNLNTSLDTIGKTSCVWCYDCETEGPVKHTEKEAIEAWNRRTVSLKDVSND